MQLIVIAALPLVACAARSPAPEFVVDSGKSSKSAAFDSPRRSCVDAPPEPPAPAPFVIPANFVGIAGRVRDPRGWTVPGATVVVLTPRPSVEVTNDDGRYAIALPPGTYDVTFYAEDQQVDVKSVAVPRGGHATLDQVVPVEPRNPGASAKVAEYVNVSLPSRGFEDQVLGGELVGIEHVGDSHKPPWPDCR